MGSFRLEDLHPDLQPLYTEWMAECDKEGLRVKGVQGWRNPSDQDKLHSSGVSPLTGAHSLHCCTISGEPASRAFDFAVFEEHGVYITDGDDPRYALAGQIAESLGLVWGKRFHHPDYDHIELAKDVA